MTSDRRRFPDALGPSSDQAFQGRQLGSKLHDSLLGAGPRQRNQFVPTPSFRHTSLLLSSQLQR